VTLRLPVQPLDSHGTTLVSGTSRDMSGPDLRSKPSTSFRNASFSASHRWARGPGGGQRRFSSAANGHAAIWALWSRRSAVGRMIARTSYSVRSRSSPSVSWSCRYEFPNRVHATRSALGAMAAVGSS
jgi:hypothetical protein